MNTKYEQLWDSLKDESYRKQFVDAYIDEGIAFQIRSLRNKKHQTQPEFARELNVKQPLVSSWENPSYGRYSLNTLKKIANAFDVGLDVRFVPFSKLVKWTVELSPGDIAPPSFTEELNNTSYFSQISTIIDGFSENKNIDSNTSAYSKIEKEPDYAIA